MKSKPWRFSFSSMILFTSVTFLLGVRSFLSFLRKIDEYAICDEGLFCWILFNVSMIASLSASGLLLFMSFAPAWTTIMLLSDLPTRIKNRKSHRTPITSTAKSWKTLKEKISNKHHKQTKAKVRTCKTIETKVHRERETERTKSI